MNETINGWEGEVPQQTATEAAPQYARSADQVFADVMAPEPQSATQTVLSEAIKRIEQAKLYETLLKHDLFGAGSARAEIMNAVQNEIREFALNRLEVLLGMKSAPVARPAVQSQFATEEVQALKSLAARMLKREVPQREATPSIVPVESQSSAVPLSQIKEQFGIAAQPTVVTAAVAEPQASVPQEVPHRGRRKTQAIVKSKCIPMPSQAVMNAQNAEVAARNEQAMGVGNLGSAITLSLKTAAKSE